MKVCVLSSGSKGNSTFIETEKTRSLVDIGVSCLYVEKALRSIGVEPSSIERIFITHTHSDHVKGLRVFLKKYNCKVIFTEKMDEELGMFIDNYSYIDGKEDIFDLSVLPVKTSHDVADSNGFVFSSNGKSFMYMTDTGYINVRNFPLLKNHNLYLLESNHDIQMLMNGKYPYHIKQRILGDKGHLSNKDCAHYLSEFTSDETKMVILAHLSEENNTPDKALEEYYCAYKKAFKKPPEVVVAKQNERLEVIDL